MMVKERPFVCWMSICVLFGDLFSLFFFLLSLDYYDDDDYYEDDYTQQQYAPPNYLGTKPSASTQGHQSQNMTQQTNKSSVAVPGKVATTASVGVTKAPPGWGKPAPVTAKTTAGITAPPPGFGKPTSSSKTSTNTASAGVSSPPPGWGKPPSTTNDASISKTASAGVAKPPPGWGKPGGESKSKATTNPKPKQQNNTPRSDPTSKNTPYVPKRVPDVLKSPKSQLSMVVLGHVDAGKSTLMGQVLVQVGKVSKREAQKNPVSWILDENEQERQRGVTMEIGTKTVR